MRKKGRYSEFTRGPWEGPDLRMGSLPLELLVRCCRDSGPGSSSSSSESLGSSSKLSWDV